MKIYVIGTENRIEELKLKLSSVEISKITAGPAYGASSEYDLIIDLNFDDSEDNIQYYRDLEDTLVIVSAVKQQLRVAASKSSKPIKCKLAGLNAFPTFINRKLWEMSFLNDADEKYALEKLNDLNIEAKKVQDRVGMVTPRIILMIINEAFYTVQEGTAEKSNIDSAMKLGTNYPMGPFEWAEKIGIKDVYEGLKAIADDTGDERYKICPLLKSSYFESMIVES